MAVVNEKARTADTGAHQGDRHARLTGPALDAAARLARFAREADARPGDADARMFHGNALMEAGRIADALAAYRSALALRPKHAPTLYNFGNALLASDDVLGAQAQYCAALALAPDHAGSHNNLGNALRRLGRHAEAAEAYRAALALRPDSFGTLNNLASALLALHRPEEALTCLDTSLRLRADYAEAWNNRGGALLALDRIDEAHAAFMRALSFEPNHAQAQFGAAMALLTLGRLRDGFAAYEARWLDPKFREGTRNYEAPLWLGDGALEGRTVLLHAEQGLGDTIQFARYAPLLRARGVRVVMEVQAPLADLLRPLADAVVAEGDVLPSHDWRTPLLSLPLAFATELQTIPAAVPYLTPPTARRDVRGPGLNIAVTLSGSADHPEDALRSIPALFLLPLLRMQNITFHIVQKDLRAADAEVLYGLPHVRLHGEALADFCRHRGAVCGDGSGHQCRYVDRASCRRSGDAGLDFAASGRGFPLAAWVQGQPMVPDRPTVPAGRRAPLGRGDHPRGGSTGAVRRRPEPRVRARSSRRAGKRRRWGCAPDLTRNYAAFGCLAAAPRCGAIGLKQEEYHKMVDKET